MSSSICSDVTVMSPNRTSKRWNHSLSINGFAKGRGRGGGVGRWVAFQGVDLCRQEYQAADQDGDFTQNPLERARARLGDT